MEVWSAGPSSVIDVTRGGAGVENEKQVTAGDPGTPGINERFRGKRNPRL